MTKEFEYLMLLVGHTVQGKNSVPTSKEIDWNRLFSLANEQSIPFLLSYALKQNPSIPCPTDLREKALKEMRQAVVSNFFQKEQIIHLLEDLDTVNIRPVVLKGFAVAEEYSIPMCRLSGDTDVFIRRMDEDRACEFMRKCGFTVQERWKKGHHAVCNHPDLGCVELHVVLYDEIVEDIWFGNLDENEYLRENYIKMTVEGGSFYTLGLTDHLIFLTLHMIKHFIIGGTSLRMMLDVGLFLKNHAHEVDLVRYREAMETLHFSECLQTILWALVQFAGFSAEDFPGLLEASPLAVNALLDDLESGGTMGQNNREVREEGWQLYQKERMTTDRGKIHYYWYMIKWHIAKYWKGMFPTLEYFQTKYPYLNKIPFLLPLAWLHRVVIKGLGGLLTGRIRTKIVIKEDSINTIAQDRARLFKLIGLI